MTFDEYRIMAKSTAIFKNYDSWLTYPILGLVGEVGELARVLEKHTRKREDIIKEMGDVCWYIAIMYDLLDSKPDYYFERRGLGFETLWNSISKIGERVKKVLRDKNGVMDLCDTCYVSEELMQLWGAIQCLCIMHEIDFAEVLQTNVEKLKSRQDRGVLVGSGDNR